MPCGGASCDLFRRTLYTCLALAIVAEVLNIGLMFWNWLNA